MIDDDKIRDDSHCEIIKKRTKSEHDELVLSICSVNMLKIRFSYEEIKLQRDEAKMRKIYSFKIIAKMT